MSNSRRTFAALFPPLLSADSTSSKDHDASDSVSDDVDISVDGLVLPPLEKAVDAAIYSALQRWNEFEPVSVESALSYMERLKKYRAIVSWILYQNDDADEASDDENELPDDEAQKEQQQQQDQGGDAAVGAGDDDTRRDHEIARRREKAAERAARREKKREKSKRRKQLQKVQKIFHALPALERLREERVSSARLQAFTSMYTPKARALVQKRSLGDTKTDLCFEFARPAPPLFSRKSKKNGDGDENDDDGDDGDGDDEYGDEVNGAATPTHNVRISNFMISRGDGGDPSSGTTAASENEELVIWLDVLHPSKEPSKTQSFLVRESQTLADVIDLVVCAYDQRLGDHDKSSKLVYFDSKFYVDRRNPENIDYADKIREWIRKAPGSRGAKYLCESREYAGASLPMESTCFRDLALKVDLPGVYVHQGECEHLLRIRDARLPHELDAMSQPSGGDEASTFPMRLPNPHFRSLRNCFICQQYSAKYICYGDRLGISDPMFFCERCYRAAHFNAKGELIYRDFQSFPYIQD